MLGLLPAPIDCLRNFSSRAIRGRQETEIDQQADCAPTVHESNVFRALGIALSDCRPFGVVMFAFSGYGSDMGAEFYEAQHRKRQISHLKWKAAKLGFQIIDAPAA